MSQPTPSQLAEADQNIAKTSASLDKIVDAIRTRIGAGEDRTLLTSRIVHSQLQLLLTGGLSQFSVAALLGVAAMRLAETGMPEQDKQTKQELDPAGPPRVISIKVMQAHAHVRVHVWIGQDGHPGKVGELVMRPEDWFDLWDVLTRGRREAFGPGVRIRYAPGTEQWLDSIRAEQQAKAGGR